MTRVRPRTLVIASCFMMAACGRSAEEQLLTKFFQAARALDSSIITRWSTVEFNPRTEGSIQSFTVRAVGPEKRDVSGAISKDVTIEAQVRDPEGRVSSRTMVVTLQRMIATGTDQAREGRWIVKGLRQTPASRTSREGSSVPPS